MINFLINALHSIPHFNFRFKLTPPTFKFKLESDYVQSLFLLAAVVGLISLLLLFTVIITWICTCCAKSEGAVKPRRKIKRLSLILFIIACFCFVFIGFSLFGNDQINRGMSSSITGLADVNAQMRIAESNVVSLGNISQTARGHVEELADAVSKRSKEINQTVYEGMETQLDKLSNALDGVVKQVQLLSKDLSDVKTLEQWKTAVENVELERWLLSVILLSVMMVVLFLGAIAFCRHSKMGAVMFSGLSLVTFLIGWLCAAAMFPASVGLADFCTQSGDFLAETFTPQMLKTLSFYSECEPRTTHDNYPPHMGVANMSATLGEMQQTKAKLDQLIDSAFNDTAEIDKISSKLLNDGTQSLKTIGALEASLACYAYKSDVTAMRNGVCVQSIIGSSVMLVALLLLGLFMFILLLIVSKSWKLFSKLGNAYIEVDEDDPFFPRTNDSNIPHDIYGTHVFNPRTRERTEPSTGTTTATNGPAETDPLWGRLQGTAPNATLTRNMYDDHYGNYQDRYDV